MIGVSWSGGIGNGSVYPRSRILAAIYLWAWGYAFLANGFGASILLMHAGGR